MTARQLEIHPEALTEAEDALIWYSERSTHAPGAFLAELEQAITAVVDAPRSWPLIDGECRRYPLSRFPYAVVYRERSANLVQIVAIAHGRRRPGYWRARVR